MTKPNDPIQELTELVLSMQTTLQEEFDKINGRLDGHDERFDRIEARMADDVSILKFRLEGIETRVGNIETHMATREDLESLRAVVDGIVAVVDTDDVERVAMSAQVTRHEDWITEAAPSTSVPYISGT